MQAVEMVAELMAVAAETAPKSKGENFVKIKIITGETLKKLADDMLRFGRRTREKDFDRDAKNVAASAAVVLIGIKKATVLGLDCGACGFPGCKQLEQADRCAVEFVGPQCAFRLLDLGIALGSAVKTAGMLNVDNRIMYRAGVVAREMGLVDWDVVMGIPLSVSGKSIYFDH